MKATEKIKKFIGRNNPEIIADKIANAYQERKENGEEHPMDDTVEEIMEIFENNPDPEKVREILKSMLEKKGIPRRLFEKTATEISNDDKLPDSIITEVVQETEKISDESIMNILEEGNINEKERINLIKNVEDEKNLEVNLKKELKTLYEECVYKKDYEVAERVEDLKKLLTENKINKDIDDLIKQIVAKKMAENYYSDIKKGTRIYELSKIMPIEDMIEYDLPSMVEKEYKNIEKERHEEKNRFDKKALKEQILIEMGKDIAHKYEETGVFIIPQSKNLKSIDKEEEEKFIKSIQIYSRKKLSKREIADIDDQVRGKSNNVQIKENLLINLIKKIPEEDKRTYIDVLSKIVSDKGEIETISMLDESGMMDKLNKMSKEKRKKTIEIIENTLDSRKKMDVVNSSKTENQQIKIDSKEPEDR